MRWIDLVVWIVLSAGCGRISDEISSRIQKTRLAFINLSVDVTFDPGPKTNIGRSNEVGSTKRAQNHYH